MTSRFSRRFPLFSRRLDITINLSEQFFFKRRKQAKLKLLHKSVFAIRKSQRLKNCYIFADAISEMVNNVARADCKLKHKKY